MSYILKPICTGIFCLFCIFSYGQFAFLYEGPDTLYVDETCTAILDWGHPETPDVFPTMPGQVIISWMIYSISGGYSIYDPVPAGETVTVFYQARDNMGHIALFGFNIVFTDHTPPEFDQETLPDDITVTCAGEIPLPTITFTDNCDSDSTMTELSFQESGDAEVCAGGMLLRTWTITDAFGNTASHVQEITVLPDTSSPVITGIPIDGSAQCGDAMTEYTAWIAAQRAIFMADDIGCGITALTDNAPPASVLLGFCGELEVAFFATDSCGNTTSILASFFVTNDTPPIITMPAIDAMVSCDSGDPQAELQDWLSSHGGAEAVDDCSLVIWSTNPAEPSLDDVCNGALIVTFIADDGCGNTASTTAEFFIQDNTPPAITTQAQNVIINCSTSDFEVELAEWLSAHGNADAMDICTNEDSLDVHFVLNGIMLDSAGVINAFQDSITNGTCADGVIIDGFIWNNVLALITLDFVFTDNCGNEATTSGIFAIRDALGPTWVTVPQDSILTCAGGNLEALFTTWYASAGFAEGTDDCGSIFYTAVPSFEEALVQLMEGLDTACASGVSIEVAFQLNDFCGNSNPAIESAVFGIVDSSGPVIIQNPSDLVIACNGIVEDALIAWLDTLGGTQVQEACGDIAWNFSWSENGDVLVGSPGVGPYPGEGTIDCNGSLEVTFSATDICDHAVSAMAEFSFIDTLAPILVVESMITIPCDSLEFIDVSVSDNCTINPMLTFIDVHMGGDTTQCLSGILIRTWQATDDCGNTVTAVQVINISDTVAPLFTAPPDTIIYCVNSGEINAGVPMGVSDNCDMNPQIIFEDNVSGTACELSISRRWSVADACENVRTAIQEITLLDTLPPALLVAPTVLVLECNALENLEVAFSEWIASGGGASLVDNCSDVRYFMAVPGSYLLEDTLTWPGTEPAFPILVCGGDTLGAAQVDMVYADACGNATVTELNILILDTEPPLIEDCLMDTLMILEGGKCEAEITLAPPRVFDLCRATIDTLNLTLTHTITSEIPGDSMVVVDTLVFNFNIPGPPAFASSPVTVNVTLSGTDADSTTEHFIILGDDAQVLGITNSTPQECDTISTALIVPSMLFNTWATDGVVSFTLLPNTIPGGSASINDICTDATATVSMIFVQGTQDSLTYAYSIDTLPRTSLDSLEDVAFVLYAGVHEFTWYITDCAGNESQCMTHITIQDSDPPQISCPEDITFMLDDNVGCGVPVVLHTPVTSDSCGINSASKQYRIMGDTLIADTFFGDTDSVIVVLDIGSYTVEYRVTDISGNLATCSFDVLITDPVAPNAVCQNGTVFVHPSGVVPFQVEAVVIDGGSTDNCRIDTMIIVPGIFYCDSAGTEQLVELIVIDESGNADTCIAALSIEVLLLEPSYTIGICAGDTLHLFANVPPAPGNPYTFSWTGPNGFTSYLENPTIPGVSSTHSGTYSVVVTGFGGCTSMGAVEVIVDDMNAPELSVVSTTVCESDAVMLIASSYNEPVTYRWFRGIAPGGLLLGNTTEPSFSDTPPLPGQYTYYIIVETENCASNPSASILVEVVETPIATVQLPFIDICEGGAFSLGTDIEGPGISYQWTGPNGFNSMEQFPHAITDAQSIHAGTYSLVILLGGCMSAPATTDVVVSPRPETPVITGDSVFCEGGDLILTINNVPDADQYFWTNPQMNSIATSGNTITLNNIDLSMEGSWTVIAMLGDCPSQASMSFNVNIENILPIIATNDGPVCDGSGDSVLLFAEIIPGVTYVWEGPGGFMSSLPNPTVLGIEGTYTVTATSSSGCTAVSSTMIVAEDPPGITALSNTAGMCADSTQSLSFAVTVFPPDNGAYDYQWTGPGGFVSNLINPVIPGLTSELNGIYTLVISLGSCMSEPASTVVNVRDAPATPDIEGVVEYCSGESVVLTAPLYPGDSVLYIWNTPVGIIQNWNNHTLVINNATVTNSGMYSVIVQIDACDSQPSEVIQVMVAQVVNEPIVQAPMSVCTGDTLRLSTQFVVGGIYHWTGPNGFVSQLRNPVIFPSTAAASGSYQVYVQVGECVSDLSIPVSVSVLPLPMSPLIESFAGSVCLGNPSAADLCITKSTATPGASYAWTYQGTPLGGPTDMRCIELSDFSMFEEGLNILLVTAELNGCASTESGMIEIPMYDIPNETADAGPDAVYCVNEGISLNGNYPSVGVGSWTSPDAAIIFTHINDPFSGVSDLSEGQNIFVWTLDYESCQDYSSDTVVIFLETTPQAVRDSVLVPFGETVDINVLINDLIDDAYTLRILPGGPLKGNALYKGQGIITYDPNLGYVGPDQITYEICSELCPEQCTLAEVIIQVGDETDCFIPTIFTPNGDGTNDRLIVPCLETERFPQNRIVIFNEWGDAVYQAQPYLNNWDGTRDGKDLPVATYFYIIDFGDGRPVQNGFLILER
ncbi:MAG TPA: gliding motility-associated C-terminal domain-containing protein [Saprospiraceae bacterium]|nr:gliding motility-associated C-terminal domain-containing protein [Saprospiraceae bacterium]